MELDSDSLIWSLDGCALGPFLTLDIALGVAKAAGTTQTPADFANPAGVTGEIVPELHLGCPEQTPVHIPWSHLALRFPQRV